MSGGPAGNSSGLKRRPVHRPELMNSDDHTIIDTYGAEYRGSVQYYLLASDAWRLNRLRWAADTSMLKTLAATHDSTVTKMARKHKAKTVTPHGLRTCCEASVERAGTSPAPYQCENETRATCAVSAGAVSGRAGSRST